MKIKLRGVRGSIPSPGPETVKYGGNTSCIEITTSGGTRIFLDAGTGIRQAGLDLLKEMPVSCAIFITHTHWDHIQGLPFFVPLFVPGCKVDIYGSFDPVEQQNIQKILDQQMQYCFFPVRQNELKAEVSYNNLKDRDCIKIGDAKVSSILMNHPALNYGYKVEADGKTLFFSGDHEPPVNIYAADDPDYQEYEELIDIKNNDMIDFFTGVDVFICDAQYTEQEYATKIGWGHGTYNSSISMARKAQAKNLYLTHHDPTRTDAQLDSIIAEITKTTDMSGMSINIARENMEILL